MRALQVVRDVVWVVTGLLVSAVCVLVLLTYARIESALSHVPAPDPVVTVPFGDPLPSGSPCPVSGDPFC